jgi:hypothetical protein
MLGVVAKSGVRRKRKLAVVCPETLRQQCVLD